MTHAARLYLQGVCRGRGLLGPRLVTPSLVKCFLPETLSSLCLHGARRIPRFSSYLIGGSFSVSFALSPPSHQDPMFLSCLGSVLDHLFSCVYARSLSDFVSSVKSAVRLVKLTSLSLAQSCLVHSKSSVQHLH